MASMRSVMALLLAARLFQFPIPFPSGTVANPIDAARRIDWSTAGVAGGIPTTRTRCTTGTGTSLLASSSTAAQINTAISGCDANHFVELGSGTFNLSAGVQFNNKSNVSLRGQGPDSTFLVFTGTCSLGFQGDICIASSDTNEAGDGASNIGTWDSGYSVGLTSVVVTRTSGAHVPVAGELIYLDQCNDGLSGATCATGTASLGADMAVCDNGTKCSGDPTPVLNGRTHRGQVQIETITSVSGTGSGPYTIGISPALRIPNVASGQSPGAYWYNAPPITGVGIENLSMDHTAISGGAGIMALHMVNSWFTNLRSVNGLNGVHKHIWMYESAHNTVSNGYYFGAGGTSEGYGPDSFNGADTLTVNNIFQHLGNPGMTEGCLGCVYAYNFTIDDFYNCTGSCPGFQQAGAFYHHSVGNAFNLSEGNSTVGEMSDNVHGTSNFGTGYRQYLNGRDPFGGSSGGKTNQTNAVILMANNRYYNFVGNVLGTSTYHLIYETKAATTTDSCSVNCEKAIFGLGFSGTGNIHDGSIPLDNDPLTSSTLMRWGNYDTVNAAVRFVSGEVPSGISPYGNPLPASQALPTSMFLSSKPAFFSSTPWPPIGPDVSGGDIANVGGHAYRIPAQSYAEDVLGILGTDTSAKTTFNANNGYPR